jgi:hypothetical protein
LPPFRNVQARKAGLGPESPAPRAAKVTAFDAIAVQFKPVAFPPHIGRRSRIEQLQISVGRSQIREHAASNAF